MTVLAHMVLITPMIWGLMEGTEKGNIKQCITCGITILSYLKIIQNLI